MCRGQVSRLLPSSSDATRVSPESSHTYPRAFRAGPADRPGHARNPWGARSALQRQRTKVRTAGFVSLLWKTRICLCSLQESSGLQAWPQDPHPTLQRLMAQKGGRPGYELKPLVSHFCHTQDYSIQETEGGGGGI